MSAKHLQLWTIGLTEDGHANRFLDPSRYIIQIWTTATDQSIAELYKQGYKLIMSNYDAWYLDCGYGAWVGDAPNNWCSPYIGWQKVYENSPRKLIVNFNVTYDEKQILGGEAALWSEQVSLLFSYLRFNLTNNQYINYSPNSRIVVAYPFTCLIMIGILIA